MSTQNGGRVPCRAAREGITEFAEMLLARRGTLPGARPDEARIALVIEGGGMRGIVAGGAVSALHDLGVTACFDAVYGASAGAMSGAYLLAGTPHAGTRMYADQLLSSRFIDARRLVRARPLMALDDLIDRLMVTVAPLDEAAVAKHPVPLRIIAGSLTTRGPIVLDESFGSLHDRLRASARVPLFAGGPVVLGGHRLIDGSVHEPLSSRRALVDGHTHLLIIRTRPRRDDATARPMTAPRMLRAIFHIRHPSLWQTGVLTTAQYRAHLHELDTWTGPETVVALAPSAPEIRPYTTDVDALITSANAGYEMVCRALRAPYLPAFTAPATAPPKPRLARHPAPIAHLPRPWAPAVAGVACAAAAGGWALRSTPRAKSIAGAQRSKPTTDDDPQRGQAITIPTTSAGPR
jgi:predicted patatin/cPLA2 family phospholipase